MSLTAGPRNQLGREPQADTRVAVGLAPNDADRDAPGRPDQDPARAAQWLLGRREVGAVGAHVVDGAVNDAVADLEHARLFDDEAGA